MNFKITLLSFLCCFFASAQTVSLQEFASGFVGPTEITHAGDARVFVSEVGGKIRIVQPDGSVESQNFLSLPTGSFLFGGERGLLGLAFHPAYSTNGYFFITYTRAPDGAIVLKRFSVDPNNPNLALPDSGVEVLTIPYTVGIHNGGQIHFGPDGSLFLACGDGGDPITSSQDINSNMGKILRINVDLLPYTVPANNPFVGIDGNDEIWAMGLRNPWKFSLDRETGALWLTDVGQSNLEEINFVNNPSGGLNFGWPCYEANAVYADWACLLPEEDYTFPFASYEHNITSCSITGGYVYRGTAYPTLQGLYVFSDFCSNGVRLLDPATGTITETGVLEGDLPFFTTMGQDAAGELYTGSFAFGKIYKITDGALATQNFQSQGYSLYPNPAQGHFFVNMPETAYPAQITVSDLSGKMLLQQTLFNASSAVITQGLQNGMYLVKATNTQGITASSKFLIQ